MEKDREGMRKKESKGQRIGHRTGYRIRETMDRIRQRALWPLLLLSCVGLVCAGCSSERIASRIQLMKTEGEVEIANGRGREVTPVPEMKLYSGYHMGTREKSYAWLNLDSLRLAKMDVSSQISIERRQKELEIFVDRGNLFFNIKEPLKEDETLDIRTGNMAVGIRGTCGWVEVPEGGDIMKVYLLEGKVLCEIEDGGWDVVRPGEMAVLTEAGEITVSDFAVADIPEFVMKELEEDEELTAQVLAASGLDVNGPADGTDPSAPEDVPGPEDESELSKLDETLEQYRTILRQAEGYSYGAAAPGDRYQYALVRMYGGDQVPTLLLSQEDVYDPYGGIENVRIFRYDPDNNAMDEPAESIRIGVASAGGFRGSLDVDGAGHGLWYTDVISSGTGETAISLVTLDGYTLHVDEQWRGRLDQVPDTIIREEIRWADREDMSILDDWASDAGASFGSPDQGGTASSEGAGSNGTVPEETVGPGQSSTAGTTAPDETTLPETTLSAENAPAETTAAAQEQGLAAYAGTYTPYSAYSSYSGGQSVTLNANGVITGGETDGRTPSSVTQNANGSFSIIFGADERYTLFPAGCAATPDGTGYDPSKTNLEYLYTYGGAMNIIYHKD